MFYICFFFFSSRRRHTRCYRDWSSDVCSSDLICHGNVRRNQNVGGIEVVTDSVVRNRSGEADQAEVHVWLKRIPQVGSQRPVSHQKELQLDARGPVFVVQRPNRLFEHTDSVPVTKCADKADDNVFWL